MDTDDSVPPVDSKDTRRTARREWSRRLPRALFESALIIFSVLLALVLNEWRDNRRQALRSQVAVEAIVAELRSNRGAAERAMTFHRSIHKMLEEVAAQGELPRPDVVTGGLFNPANIVETAWVSARETAALEEWPYDLILQVSRVYERQAGYSNLGRQIVADVYMDLRRRGVEVVLQEGYGGFILLTQDFAGREDALIRQYDTALAAIEGHVH